jgi:hypothetical protein
MRGFKPAPKLPASEGPIVEAACWARRRRKLLRSSGEATRRSNWHVPRWVKVSGQHPSSALQANGTQIRI